MVVLYGEYVRYHYLYPYRCRCRYAYAVYRLPDACDQAYPYPYPYPYPLTSRTPNLPLRSTTVCCGCW